MCLKQSSREVVFVPADQSSVENLPLLLYGTNNHGNTQWKADREEFCPLVENNVLLSIRLDTVLHRLLTWSLCHGHFGPEELHIPPPFLF